MIPVSQTSIQQNAQAALPVIPNNGNPGGAHNMPQDRFAWLQPSEAMVNVQKFLAERQQRLGNPQPSVAAPAAPVAPVQPQPQVILPQQNTAPNIVLPTQRTF